MAQFSLSPGVSVKEYNLTGYVPNIPSAKTGMILRADRGPAMDVTALTNENDLVTVFGKPTAANFQDWYQAWNFLQYASSLYVVRPIDANGTTENAVIGVSDTGVTPLSKPNFYNASVAQHSLENFSDKSEALYFINKDVTSDQRLAVAVCSSPVTFKNQLGLEYFAVINSAPTTGSTVLTTNGSPTLTNGSQVILNGDKLATVTYVSQSSSASADITFDRAVSAVDVDAFYGVAVTGTGLAGTFKKAGFTLKVGTVIKTDYVVSAISNNALDNSMFDVTFISKAISGTSVALTGGEIVSSSEVYFTGKTAFNASKGDFGVQAGDMSVVLQPGFILEAGTKISIGAVDTTVASIDNTLNKVYFTAPVTAKSDSVSAITLSITLPVIDKIVIGINFFDKVYDSGLIKKTRKVLTDKSGKTVNVIAQSLVPFSAYFDYTPNWTNDEFAVVILRKNDDGFYEKVESFTVSYNPSAKDNNGQNIFVENVLNKMSKYLYAKIGDVNAVRPSTSNFALAKIVGNSDTIYPKKGGSSWDSESYNAFNYTTGDIMQAYTLFADPEQFDINIIMCHQLDINYASTIAETRKDCIAVVAPYDSQYLSVNSANDCTSYLLDNFGSQTEFDNKLFTSFGTYSAFYGNMKYQYDKFNNVNRWICVAGDIAGLYAQTDATNDPWWASAGTTRGIIKNAIKLAFNPNTQNRDEMYVNAINPIMVISGEGNAVVWGQKTATATPSAMDRVNVRRLLIFIEKSISIASSVGLFEFNDVFTRNRLFNIIDPFLRSVKARRGLYNYNIVIDETNNTNQVIDSNGLVIDIYLQPTKVAEMIRINAAIIPTGANFSEYVGSF